MRGFTLIELVVVILLMAILMVTAAPRFFARNDFEGPAYAQELASAARYAQKLALATGCPVEFVVAASTYSLTKTAADDCSGGFTLPARHPATGEAFTGTAPDGIVATGTLGTFVFNSRGVPSMAGSLGVAGRTVVIAAGTGYVEVQ